MQLEETKVPPDPALDAAERLADSWWLVIRRDGLLAVLGGKFSRVKLIDSEVVDGEGKNHENTSHRFVVGIAAVWCYQHVNN